MYKITIDHIIQVHEFEELIKVFLNPTDFIILNNETITDNLKISAKRENEEEFDNFVSIIVPEELSLNYKGAGGRNAIKQFLFKSLADYTGKVPDWGIHTGVRPVKLLFELVSREGTLEKAKEILRNYYLISDEKIGLLTEVYNLQRAKVSRNPENHKGVYIGIPFCPTRCEYCSFPSNQGSQIEVDSYLEALHKEISFTAKEMSKKNWYAETIYIGGGTPTALSDVQLSSLLKHVKVSFDFEILREFTLEAGRPDTITEDKLLIACENGITRISINPQSMKAETLKAIGRNHSPEEIEEAFLKARDKNISVINADLIAGLPNEDLADFTSSLNKIIDLQAENITIHTLAMKRASKLKIRDGNFHLRDGEKVRKMLETAEFVLKKAGYKPYYLYRQKQMTGNFENVGWGKPDTENLYNIRIMEETQTIIALGAGGISKVYYPLENRLERVPNVSNFQIYTERIEEMINRKRIGLFQ